MKLLSLLPWLALGALAAAADPAPPVARLKVAPDDPDSQWLSDLRVPEGFDATIFAHPPMIAYPIFVAAAPDGTLYVGSDANCSLDRQLHRGCIYRLRDTKGTGHADEVKKFVPDVDSPRGVLWDHDRLFVLHPPDLSVYIDHQGTGEADEKQDLVKGIGWTFKDRPADHASNGIEMGIDGWIYCAIGDFGFMKAEGTDGRTLQMRGGGIVRVRPDGTGFEIYSTGTRNILEPAVSPELDIFARDNTNDGDGWDERFHHFTGLEDHGYPRLFKHFSDEIVARLADYGGGGATGAAWVDEPGIPAYWNQAPFTCDWGRDAVYQHRLAKNGATFTIEQTEFLGMTRVVDTDIDASSRLYFTSLKGATFSFAGPEVGYIARLTPHGYQAPPLPDFEHLEVPALVPLLENASARIRLEAQRALLRRGPAATAAIPALQALATDGQKPLATRIAALFALKQMQGAEAPPFLATLAEDESIAAWAIRALTDREDQLASVPLAPILAGLSATDARIRRESTVSIARLGKLEQATALVPLLDDRDPVVSHTAVAALRRLHAWQLCLSVLDSPAATTETRARALQVLETEHRPEVVNALLERLAQPRVAEARQGIITALCRLYYVEGEWHGDSWGTRPDTSGPYYQPEEWSESKAIGDALLAQLSQAGSEDAKFLSAEFARHRLHPGNATSQLLALATKDPTLAPALAREFVEQKESAPLAAVPLLAALANDRTALIYDRSQAIQALVKIDNPEAMKAVITGLSQAGLTRGNRSEQEWTDLGKARDPFLKGGWLDNQLPLLEEMVEHPGDDASLLAEAAIVKLAGRKFGAPEPRQRAAEILAKIAADPQRAAELMHAMTLAEDGSQARLLLPYLKSPDAAIAKTAAETFKRLNVDPASLEKPAGDGPQLLSSMKTEEILAAIAQTHGDRARGEQLFTQQGCVACHTTKAEEPLKGPFLGAIANVYQRRELAENILLPSKTIAQGFATNHFELNNGNAVDGFVTLEGADKVTIRTIASQEMTFPKTDIKQRSVLEKSMMPEGLVGNLSVKDFASLLDYLEALAKK